MNYCLQQQLDWCVTVKHPFAFTLVGVSLTLKYPFAAFTTTLIFIYQFRLVSAITIQADSVIPNSVHGVVWKQLNSLIKYPNFSCDVKLVTICNIVNV